MTWRVGEFYEEATRGRSASHHLQVKACPQQPLVELSDQSLQRFVALFAASVTLLLVFAQGVVLKALQAGEQHINKVVLEPENTGRR
jgi:hypothetical protein